MGRNSTSHQFDTFIGAASATVIAVAVAVPSTVIKKEESFIQRYLQIDLISGQFQASLGFNQLKQRQWPVTAWWPND